MSDSLLRALAHQATLAHVIEKVNVANPGAGNQWSFALPGDRIWRIRGVVGKLTTSAVAGNRQVGITVSDQSDVLACAVAPAVTAAALATTYAFNINAPGNATASAGGFASCPLPDIIVPGGFIIASVATAFDPGDAWTGVRIWAETLLSQPMGVHEYRDALELAERVMTSPFLGGM